MTPPMTPREKVKAAIRRHVSGAVCSDGRPGLGLTGVDDATDTMADRAAEAERKPAEVVALMHLTNDQLFAAINASVTITKDRNGVDNGAVCISPDRFRTFISKEAERG